MASTWFSLLHVCSGLTALQLEHCTLPSSKALAEGIIHFPPPLEDLTVCCDFEDHSALNPDNYLYLSKLPSLKEATFSVGSLAAD